MNEKEYKTFIIGHSVTYLLLYVIVQEIFKQHLRKIN